MVKVFYSDISNLDEFTNYDNFCIKRINYLNSITARERKKQSVYVWKLLIKCLEILNISFDNGFDFENNKWSLNRSSYFFSLAHSKNIVVVAIGDNEVGVDVELLSEKLFRVAKKKFNSTTENELVLAKLWVEMECKIKNTQIGKFTYKFINDLENNEYLLGLTAKDEISLEKINLG